MAVGVGVCLRTALFEMVGRRTADYSGQIAKGGWCVVGVVVGLGADGHLLLPSNTHLYDMVSSPPSFYCCTRGKEITHHLALAPQLPPA